jgi:RNA polymerase sigma factor (sigma-70 family)
MAEHTLNKVLRHIRMLAAVQAYRDFADRELLDRFVKEKDESAFTVLIERYGPMVLAACHRLLGNLHDAEDVCQATFLVLARKAASIRQNTALPGWLHGVACRVAGRFKRDRARQQSRERQTPRASARDTASEVSWREIQALLDEELERLPKRYRAPLILCYLDGKTRDEAARHLGLSTGALHGRLGRGRELLRQRLTRRGLTLSSALLPTVLGDGAARAGLVPTLTLATSRAALAIITNQPIVKGVVSATVLTLTREALTSMLVAKLKLGTIAVLACLVALVTCSALTPIGVAQDLSPPQAAVPPKAPLQKDETDREFIRRISLELRGVEPNPTEVHFFVTSKEARKREKLIELMIEERGTKKGAERDSQARTPEVFPLKQEKDAKKPADKEPGLRDIDGTHVRLTLTEPQIEEAWLRDLLIPKREVRIGARAGIDTFQLWDQDTSQVVARAKVLRVDHRDVYFQVQQDVYCIHIGETIARAMRRPLSQAELDALKIRPHRVLDKKSEQREKPQNTPAKGALERFGKLLQGLPKWFNDLDTNRDGQVSLSEWHKAGRNIDEFREWDRDDDGLIIPHEVIFNQRLEGIERALKDLRGTRRASNINLATLNEIRKALDEIQTLDEIQAGFDPRRRQK